MPAGVPGRPRPAGQRPSPVGPAVGGAGRVHDRGRQRGRAPPTAPHRQVRPVARRGRRRALADLPADVGQLPALPPRRGNHGGRAPPPGEDRTNQDGMRRWRYVSTRPTRAGASARGPARPSPHCGGPPRPRGLGRPTEQTEARWRSRYGADAIEGLRAALAAIVPALDPAFPDCLPILGHGLCAGYRAHQMRLPSRNTRPGRDPPAAVGAAVQAAARVRARVRARRPARPRRSAPTSSG